MQKYTFDGLGFKNLILFENYVREKLKELYLQKQTKITKESTHWKFFWELVNRHRRASEKIGNGIDHFIIGKNFYGHIDLTIVSIEGVKVDISWNKCVRNGKSTTVLDKLKAAMKNAVEYQIAPLRGKKGVVCEICSQVIEKGGHVDHIIHFEEIVQKFLILHPKHPLTFDDHPLINSAIFKIEDEEFEKAFATYHASFTDNLRLTHSWCNLRRKKYKKPTSTPLP